MRVITALVIVAGVPSVCGCARPYQEVSQCRAVAAPACDEGEVGKDHPPSPETDKDEVGETTSDTGREGSTHSILKSFERKFGTSGPTPVSSKHYVVRDTVGNCAVLVLSAHLNLLPGNILARPGEDLEIIGDQGGYASSESANDALQDAKSHCTGAEAKFKAAQAKAEMLGGVDKLTSDDIEGLSQDGSSD